LKTVPNNSRLQRSALLVVSWVILILNHTKVDAQDFIFLRNSDAFLPCIIVQANDSIIVYRTLNTDDPNFYSLRVSEIYGYVLEDPKAKMLDLSDTITWSIKMIHTAKSKQRTIKTGQSFVYKLKSDSIDFWNKGSIKEIVNDTLLLQRKRRKDIEFSRVSLNDIKTIGYSNLWTEALSWFIFPVESVSSGIDVFYVTSSIDDGWVFQILVENKPYPVKRIRKNKGWYKHPGRLFRKQPSDSRTK
jgi:hypothetical protein